MQSTRRAAHVGILAAVVVLAGSLSLIGARQNPVMPVATEVDQVAPDFILSDTRGGSFDSRTRLQGQVTVLCFTSAQCPSSNKYRSRVVELARQYADQQVQFVAIHPIGASPTSMELDEIRAQDRVTGQHFPSLIDAGGQVAAMFGAAGTPLFVVLDPDGRIRYRGRFDDSPDPTRVTQHYVADAVRGLLEPHSSQVAAFTQAGGRLLR